MRARADFTTSVIETARFWKARHHFLKNADADMPGLIAYAKANGLDLDRLNSWNVTLGLMRACFGDGRFHFVRPSDDHQGEAVVVIEIADPTDIEAEICDLAAWTVADPNVFATLFGTPIRQPLAWLRDGAPYYDQLIQEG